MVLVEQAHGCIAPEGHVSTGDEGHMTSIYLLVVNDGLANFITSPARVCKISQWIVFTGKHGHISLDVL